jgi:hypothetical protein
VDYRLPSESSESSSREGGIPSIDFLARGPFSPPSADATAPATVVFLVDVSYQAVHNGALKVGPAALTLSILTPHAGRCR